MPLRLEVLGNLHIVVICFLSYDVKIFEINPSFLVKPFSNMTKITRKTFGITKRAVNMKQKAFFFIFIGLLLKQIKQTFLEGESPALNEILLPKHQYVSRTRTSLLSIF